MNALPTDTLLEWRLLTGRDIDALDRESTVIIGSVSPLEVHGPHLPVTTDVTEAEGLLLAAIEKVRRERPDITFVRLPPLWVASDVLPQTGSIGFRPDTLRRVLMDLGASLAGQGFRHVWLSNFHGGPRHFVAMEDALHRVNRRHGTAMISVFSLLLHRLADDGSHELGGVLGDLPGADPEAFAGDMHGGYVETSMMLHLIGEHVRDHTDLPPVTVGSWRASKGLPAKPPHPLAAFRDSFRFFKANSYAGSPAGASAELGARFVDTLATHTADALVDLWDGKLSAADARSPLFKYRRVLLSRALGWFFENVIA